MALHLDELADLPAQVVGQSSEHLEDRHVDRLLLQLGEHQVDHRLRPRLEAGRGEHRDVAQADEDLGLDVLGRVVGQPDGVFHQGLAGRGLLEPLEVQHEAHERRRQVQHGLLDGKDLVVLVLLDQLRDPGQVDDQALGVPFEHDLEHVNRPDDRRRLALGRQPPQALVEDLVEELLSGLHLVQGQREGLDPSFPDVVLLVPDRVPHRVQELAQVDGEQNRDPLRHLFDLAAGCEP